MSKSVNDDLRKLCDDRGLCTRNLGDLDDPHSMFSDIDSDVANIWDSLTEESKLVAILCTSEIHEIRNGYPEDYSGEL